MTVGIATKSRHLALLCDPDIISDCLLACTVILFQSLFYIPFYTKPGAKEGNKVTAIAWCKPALPVTVHQKAVDIYFGPRMNFTRQ